MHEDLEIGSGKATCSELGAVKGTKYQRGRYVVMRSSWMLQDAEGCMNKSGNNSEGKGKR